MEAFLRNLLPKVKYRTKIKKLKSAMSIDLSLESGELICQSLFLSYTDAVRQAVRQEGLTKTSLDFDLQKKLLLQNFRTISKSCITSWCGGKNEWKFPHLSVVARCLLGSAALAATVKVDNGLAGLFTSVELVDMKIFVIRNKEFLRFDSIKEDDVLPKHTRSKN